MQLTLVVPGLVWLDSQQGREAVGDLDLPGLSLLLGRGQRNAKVGTLSTLISQCFGLSSLAVATELAAQDGLATAACHWLRADPVHICLEQQRASLIDNGLITLSQAEANAFVATLNHHFADEDLRFYAPAPKRWYVATSSRSTAQFTVLLDVIGENINDHLPAQDHGLVWNRRLNEIQMLLYCHPINDEREKRGDLPVNSVWFWGESNTEMAAARYDLVLSDNDHLTLLAAHVGMRVARLPPHLPAMLEKWPDNRQILAMPEYTFLFAQYRDVEGWRSALHRLEEAWFAPALQALRCGRISVLTLSCHGPSGLTATIRRADLWKRWRKALALHRLYC